MNHPTPEQLQLALLKAYTDKSDAEAKVKEADAQIAALRNLLTGHQMAAQTAQAAAAAAEKLAAGKQPAPPSTP